MKNHKLLIALLMTVFVMSTSLVLADESSTELEKIPSPDKIKDYENIKKEGNSLWGIKKEIAKKMREMENEMKKKSQEIAKETNKKITEISLELEKIPSPDKIKDYENIKKEGNSLWGIKKEIAKKMREMENEMKKKSQEIAKETNKNNSVNKPLVRQSVVTAEAVECVSNAIEVKDLAIAERVILTSTELKTAITDRSSCQKEAIKTTEKQEEYLKNCVEAYRQANKLIVETSKMVREAAWSEYKKSLSSCMPKTATTVNGVEETVIINDGGESIEESVQ